MNYDLQSKMLTKTAEYLERTGVLVVCVERVYKAAESIDELEKRAKNAEKIVDEYAESARAIALWLSGYCDKTLSYPSMISNAARKISVAYADMEKRAEQAEKERDDYK